MKKYELLHQGTGHVFGYYDTYDEAQKALNYANDPRHLLDGEYSIIELPEVEEPELDYQYINCLINEMIDSMEKISKLANLDYISLSYFITENKDTGACMSAWDGESHSIAIISDNTNRTNIFERIYKQIKEGQTILNKIKEDGKNDK